MSRSLPQSISSLINNDPRDFDYMISNNIKPLGQIVARNYPGDMQMIQRTIRSRLKTNFVPGYLPRVLPISMAQSTTGRTNPEELRVYGPGSFFFNLYQILYLDRVNSPGAGAGGGARAGMGAGVRGRGPQDLKQLGFTYPPGYTMNDTVRTILYEIIQATNSNRTTPDAPQTTGVTKTLIDKINHGYEVHQARLPQQLWSNQPPVFYQGSFRKLIEPNMNEIVQGHVSTAGRSDASKKAVVAAALRNMRDYEFIMALKQIMDEIQQGGLTLNQQNHPGLWSMRSS